jgi:hypothetical protein
MTNSGNCSRANQRQIISVIGTQSGADIGANSHRQAMLDDQLAMDDILDRFTLALARQIAREDHEKAMNENFIQEGQQ